MIDAFFRFGLVLGVLLLGLLIATRVSSTFRLWPTPGEKTWQSYTFWPLFRGLNVFCFIMAGLEWSAVGTDGVAQSQVLPLPGAVRSVAAMALLGSIALFLYAFFKLGRDNSYGAQDGLVTAGIYQWSRNPQNAMLIVVYSCLAIAVGLPRTAALCALMVAVYHVMVLCEEPWLHAVYGEPYVRYLRAVPRYFNWRRLWSDRQ